MAENGNGKSNFGGFFAVLFILAAFAAMIGNFIRPIEQDIQHLNTRIEQVYSRAESADHLPEITAQTEQINHLAGDIGNVRDIEDLRAQRTHARLEKLERWRDEDEIKIEDLQARITALEVALTAHSERDLERYKFLKDVIHRDTGGSP